MANHVDERRRLFLAALGAAEAAVREGDFDHALACLPPRDELWLFQNNHDVENRYYIVHAVATDRPDR